jgi:hypothetical protein
VALSPLATTDDLVARGIDVTDAALADTMLDVASATLRGAAGSPISETTSTVSLVAWGAWDRLRLPGPPVTSVSAVELDGKDITAAVIVDGDRLWNWGGWGAWLCPARVEVTYTHGLREVPADIADLVCSFAAAGMHAASEGGYAARSGVIAERIDDYSVQYAQGADAVANVMEVPARTRAMLRARFGASAGTVTMR